MDFGKLLTEVLGWAPQLAVAMAVLTGAAMTLLSPAKKESLSLWLMGAESEGEVARFV